MKEVILFICYARSGGTLLSKVLSTLDEIYLLSEVNPITENVIHENVPDMPPNIYYQIKRDFNIEILKGDYLEKIHQVLNIISKLNKKLVIRDWTYINFAKHPANNYKVSGELINYYLLKHDSTIKLKSFAFVRDTIDVWISRGLPDLITFSSEYSKYIDEIFKNNIKIFKYEDFCSDPFNEFNKLCSYLGLIYKSNFIKKFKKVDTVSGDTSVIGGSRGAHLSNIKLLKRKRITRKDLLELAKCDLLREINKKLGYPISYYDRDIESYKDYFTYNVKRFYNILKEIIHAK